MSSLYPRTYEHETSGNRIITATYAPSFLLTTALRFSMSSYLSAEACDIVVKESSGSASTEPRAVAMVDHVDYYSPSLRSRGENTFVS